MNKKALYTILIIIILVLIFVGLKITGNVVSKSQTNFVYFDAEKSDEISTFDSYAALTYWSKEGYDFVLTSSKKEADISVVWKKETVEEHNKNKDGLTIHLGDSKCNSWNYYDDSTLETLLIHNLGHAIGKEDSQDPKYLIYINPPRTYKFVTNKSIEFNEAIIEGGSFSGQTCTDILEKNSRILNNSN